MTQINPSLVAVEHDGSRQALRPSDCFVARAVHERVRIRDDGSNTPAVAAAGLTRAIGPTHPTFAQAPLQGQAKFSGECPQWCSCFDDVDTASQDHR